MNLSRYRSFLPALILTLTVPSMLGAQAGQKPAEGAGATQRGVGQTTNGQTSKIQTGDVERSFFITGELQAARSIQISVPRIRSSFASAITYLAPEGSFIRQGERLLEFDPSALLSSKSEAERRLDEAKITIEKTREDLAAQETDLLNAVAQAQAGLKVAELYARTPQELLAANTYQKYKLDRERAQLTLNKAQEQLANFRQNHAAQMALAEVDRAQADIELKKIESDLALLSIAAPQDGIVIYGDNWANNRKIQVGDNLFPGQPAVSLPDLSSLQVIGFVYDTELARLSRGARCNFSLDGVPGTHFTGTIIELTSVAARKGFASQHKVFRAIIQPDKLDLAIMKPGMTTRVEIRSRVASQVTAVAREYLGLDANGRYYVLKTDKDNPVKLPVEVGAFGDRMVEIVSGVSGADALLPVQKVWED